MATYEVTLRDVADRVDELRSHVDGRLDALARQFADLRSDVAGLRGEWRLAKWMLAVFGAPAWAAVIYVIVRDVSSSA